MAKSYSKGNLVEYLEQAKVLLEAEKIPDYDKFLTEEYLNNPVFSFLDSVLFIVDFREDRIVYTSKNSLEIEGYSSDFLTGLSATGYFDLLHPLDAELVVNKVFVDGMGFTAQMENLELSKFKVAYNYRLRQPNGTYKMLMQQFSYLMVDEERNPLMIIGTVSDISGIQTKQEMFVRITVQNSKGKWEKIFERFYSLTEGHNAFNLSPKELEIIRLASDGLSSKEIAAITNKSIETIHSQKKSILKKTNLKSMTEVILKSKENNWI